MNNSIKVLNITIENHNRVKKNLLEIHTLEEYNNKYCNELSETLETEPYKNYLNNSFKNKIKDILERKVNRNYKLEMDFTTSLKNNSTATKIDERTNTKNKILKENLIQNCIKEFDAFIQDYKFLVDQIMLIKQLCDVK